MVRAFITCVVVAGMSAGALAGNLLKNPSFEELDAGQIAHWAVRGLSWYEEPKSSGLSEVSSDDAVLQGAGHRSLKMVGAKNRGIAQQVLRCDPGWGKRLRLSGWIKVQDIAPACGRISVEFTDEHGKWSGIANVATDWRKSTADWEYFDRQFEVPGGTSYLIVSCSTDKANNGIVWFDNVSLEPVVAESPAAEKHAELQAALVDGIVPVDTFEGDHIQWYANAWAGAQPAQFSLQKAGSGAGQGSLRVRFLSAANNTAERRWNYDGKWDGLSFRIRKVAGSGGLTLWYGCGEVYFSAKWVSPTAEWQRVPIVHRDVRYSWGARSEEDKVFDPAKVTKLSFGAEGLIEFELNQIAVDVRDDLGIRAVSTQIRANLFAPGERPAVRTEIFNGYFTAQSPTLEVELLNHRDRVQRRDVRALRLPPRTYRVEAIQLPALPCGYYAARVKLILSGRVVAERSVGICVLPPPLQEGKAFMGASGFGMGTGDADIGHKLGVRAAEFMVSWKACEPERGKVDIDDFAKTLDVYEKHRFETTGMIYLLPRDVPDWANAAPDPKDRGRYFAKDPADFGRFVEALVNRYKSRVHRWSFCCEVDLSMYDWAQGLDGYAAMVKAAYEGAKRADPSCVVGGIGVSGVDCTANPRFPVAERLWKQLSGHLDGFFFDAYASPHYFGPALRVVGPEENDEEGMLKEALRIVRHYGSGKRVAIEEKGWAIDERLGVDSPYAKDMADVLARSFIIARSVEEVDHYMWFQLLTSWAEGGNSYSLFRFEGDHLDPRPAAAAYAFVARFLAGVQKPQKVKLHQDLFAYVFAKGAGSRAALWTPLPNEVSVEVTLPKSCRITDLMGAEMGRGTGTRQTLRLSASPIYLWDEKTPSHRLSALLQTGAFHLPCAKLALTIPDTSTLLVHARSQVSGGLRGVLSAQAPRGWSLVPARQVVPLADAKPTVFPFHIAGRPSPLQERPGTFRVGFKSADKGEVRLEVEPVFHSVRRLTGPVRIDGNVSKWTALPAIRLDSQAYLTPPDAAANGLWTGVDDLSVVAWVAWDQDNFYFAARVRDDKFVQEQTGPNLWANDCIQIAFDPLSDALGAQFTGRSGYDPDDCEFGIALTPQGPQTFQWVGSPGGRGRLLPEVKLSVKREGEGTFYEWALPWKYLRPLQPRVGSVFGFNFVVIDADKPGDSAPYWMGLTSGICGGKDPAAFHHFVLTD